MQRKQLVEPRALDASSRALRFSGADVEVDVCPIRLFELRRGHDPPRVGPMSDAVAVVRGWNDAFNARDVEHMVTITHHDVEFVTPRGVTHGHAALREFMERQTFGVGLTVIPRRYFGVGEVVVVEALNELRYVESGDLADSFDGAATFTLRDGRVARFVPHHDLQSALAEAGLDETSEVPEQ